MTRHNRVQFQAPMKALIAAALMPMLLAGCSMRDAADMIPMSVQNTIVTEDVLTAHTNPQHKQNNTEVTVDAAQAATKTASSPDALLAEARAHLQNRKVPEISQATQAYAPPAQAAAAPRADALFQNYMANTHVPARAAAPHTAPAQNPEAMMLLNAALRGRQEADDKLSTGSIPQPGQAAFAPSTSDVKGLEEQARLRRASLMMKNLEQPKAPQGRIASRFDAATAKAPAAPTGFRQSVQFMPASTELAKAQEAALRLQLQALLGEKDTLVLIAPEAIGVQAMQQSLKNQARLNSLMKLVPEGTKIEQSKLAGIDHNSIELRILKQGEHL